MANNSQLVQESMTRPRLQSLQNNHQRKHQTMKLLRQTRFPLQTYPAHQPKICQLDLYLCRERLWMEMCLQSPSWKEMLLLVCTSVPPSQTYVNIPSSPTSNARRQLLPLPRLLLRRPPNRRQSSSRAPLHNRASDPRQPRTLHEGCSRARTRELLPVDTNDRCMGRSHRTGDTRPAFRNRDMLYRCPSTLPPSLFSEDFKLTAV